MTKYIQVGGLQVANILFNFIEKEVIPGTDLNINYIFYKFEKIILDLAPKNQKLLTKRIEIQTAVDQWHQRNNKQTPDRSAYKKFLYEIGYIVPEGPDFQISTSNLDKEIGQIAGPQLVVPITNARFAINATNARWGSLYDALYGSDIFPGFNTTAGYDPSRGKKVVQYAMAFLDKTIPLKEGSHSNVSKYHLRKKEGIFHLVITLDNNCETSLHNPEQFIGYQGKEMPSAIVFKNNNLHLEIQIDPQHPIGALSSSGMKDIILESALSTIQDLEDSVATVDANDKVGGYRNWLGLMKGSLQETFDKNGSEISRKMNDNRRYQALDGTAFNLSGRSLLFVRNVGPLMTTNAVLDRTGAEIPEGFLDAFITTLCALHDLKPDKALKNSQTGSIYIVKPKLHGPEEVALTDELFTRIEEAMNLPENTVKIGLMDEERRTSVNLKETIRAIKNRIFFINTGFLDRTGDEIHTSMKAGPFPPKDEIKSRLWLKAYENNNVDTGLKCGFANKAQIGKGMWAKPDEMSEMMTQKIDHPLSGANCAWVPSPTAATLHALHYHDVNVFHIQEKISSCAPAQLDDILTIPLMNGSPPTPTQVQKELDNNIQGILGYVVRWIDQGIGCSKVPDINNINLMEDRATLRISSQHIANWLEHGICSKAQIIETLGRISKIVNQQNAQDPNYHEIISDTHKSLVFSAACDLIFKGTRQPNGYTEPILHASRLKLKDTFTNTPL